MTDFGPLPTKNSLKGSPSIIPSRHSAMRVSMFVFNARTSPGWAGDDAHPLYKTLFYRTRSTTPSWWGLLPTGSNPVLPNYKLQGRVMQRDPETLEDTPVYNARVVLFFRRTNYVVDMQVSDEDGYVTFPNIMPGDQAYYAIAFDPEGAPMQNSILWDRLSAVPA